MSKLYDLLNSIISKLKATEKSMPKKVSDLEQDIANAHKSGTPILDG